MLIFGLHEDTFAQASMWVVNFIYLFGIFPQLRLNYKKQTTAGLSSITLLGYVLAYILQITYTYSLDMPLSYKVMLPIAFSTVLFMAGQHVYYAGQAERRSALLRYSAIMLFGLLLAPIAYAYPQAIGPYAGWVAMGVWTVYLLPQGIKMYLGKSVVGFSFAYATFMTMGSVLESTSAWLLSNGNADYWPLIYNGIRGVSGYIVFCVQFLLYGRK